MRTKLSDGEFIKRAIAIHGDRFNYDESQFRGLNYPIVVVCPTHGQFIIKQAKTHLISARQGVCPSCLYENANYKGKGNTELFIQRATNTHGNKFSYDKTIYESSNKKVIITCPTHGDFLQRPNDHLSGYGCDKCRPNRRNDNFIEQAKIIHGDRYDYSKVTYINRLTKVDILCYEHGTFNQTPSVHLTGSGCPKCRTSKGESKIMKELQYHHIEFEYQKTFEGCVSSLGRLLRFDFYIPSINTLIEYDGQQHLTLKGCPTWASFNSELLQKHDQIKTNYAYQHKLTLIRIPHTSFNNINIIIANLLDFYKCVT